MYFQMFLFVMLIQTVLESVSVFVFGNIQPWKVNLEFMK